MEDLIQSYWLELLVVLVTQFLNMYLRAKNIMHTMSANVLMSGISTITMGLMFIIPVAIGAKHTLEGDWFGLAIFLIGGAFGSMAAVYIKKTNKEASS